MRERDATPEPAARPGARPAVVPQALPQAIGNRAMARVVARMEASDAVDALKESLAPGVMGAEHRVIDTMAAMSADAKTFDTVAKDFEKQVEAPLPPALEQVPGAPGLIPQGWAPGTDAS